MSVAHTSWAHVCSPTAGVARAVLLALADHANDDDVAWPAIDTLVTYAGFKERAVQKALREMTDASVLANVTHSYVRHYRRPGAHTSAYRLNLALCHWDGVPPVEASWANKCLHRGVHVVHPDGQGGCAWCTEGVHVVREEGARRAPDPPMIPHRNTGVASQVDQDTGASARDNAVTADGVHRGCGSVHDPRHSPCPVPTARPANFYELAEASRTVSNRRPLLDDELGLDTCFECGRTDDVDHDGLCRLCRPRDGATLNDEPVEARHGA